MLKVCFAYSLPLGLVKHRFFFVGKYLRLYVFFYMIPYIAFHSRNYENEDAK